MIRSRKLSSLIATINERLKTFAPIKIKIHNIKFVIFNSIFNADIDIDKYYQRLENIKNHQYKVIIIDSTCLINVYTNASGDAIAAGVIQKNTPICKDDDIESKTNDIETIISLIELIDRKSRDEIEDKIITLTIEDA